MPARAHAKAAADALVWRELAPEQQRAAADLSESFPGSGLYRLGVERLGSARSLAAP